ncbi:hypothetical protein AUR04nite_01690 [Glutamicibacter uratoxydans]|uniref:DUF6318 domain-containing protein n=1 Tax=Glutamicibacter uratoxydans TaxID=43667 RepID=A0A4Y4DJ33_GLUUR|nr:DUF6318 family protein [Glutamicibacter uratoxydans]GED04637.1 hypothetical protein AUR04nite_01690 [Glutamicibacter uratoxydans]
MNTRKFVNVVLVAAFSIALAGCTLGSSESDPSSTSSTTPPTASSGIAASSDGTTKTEDKPKYRPADEKGPAENVPLPKMPDEAKKNSPSGAEAFVKYYVDLINYVSETNDTKEIKKVTSRHCKECAISIIDPADYSKKINEWQVGGKYKFTIIDTYQPEKSNVIITTIFTSTPFRTYQNPKEVIGEYSKVSPTYGTFQVRFNDGWKVTEFLVTDNKS